MRPLVSVDGPVLNATIAVTLDTYSHVLPGMSDGLADTMDEALG